MTSRPGVQGSDRPNNVTSPHGEEAVTRHLPQCAAHRLRPQGREWGNKTGQGRGNSTGTKLAVCPQGVCAAPAACPGSHRLGLEHWAERKGPTKAGKTGKTRCGATATCGCFLGSGWTGQGCASRCQRDDRSWGSLRQTEAEAPADEVAPLSSNRAERSEQWGKDIS